MQAGTFDADHLLRTPNTALSTVESAFAKRNLIYSAMQALKFVHEKDLVHGDFKLKNLVSFPDNTYRLIDWDTAVDIGRPLTSQYTLIYCPPERAKRLVAHDDDDGGDSQKKENELLADPSYDIWCLGCMAYEVFMGVPLFPEPADDEQREVLLGDLSRLNDIKIKSKIAHLENANKPLYYLLCATLAVNPAQRQTLDKILTDPMFQARSKDTVEVRCLDTCGFELRIHL
jgi:serine/threonine protein kinase